MIVSVNKICLSMVIVKVVNENFSFEFVLKVVYECLGLLSYSYLCFLDLEVQLNPI